VVLAIVWGAVMAIATATMINIWWQHRQLKQQWFEDGAVRGYGDCDNDRYIFYIKSNNQLAATIETVAPWRWRQHNKR